MAKVCSICIHDDREEIDQALFDGESYRKIATRTGTSIGALHRHRQHLKDPPLKVEQLAKENSVESFRDRLDTVKRATSAMLAQSLKEGRYAFALKTIARMEEQLKLEAGFLAKLPDSLIKSLGLHVGEKEVEKPDYSLLSADELRTLISLLEKAQRPKAA